MIDRLIKKTKKKESGFYLDDWNDLRKQLDHLELEISNKKII